MWQSTPLFPQEPRLTQRGFLFLTGILLSIFLFNVYQGAIKIVVDSEFAVGPLNLKVGNLGFLIRRLAEIFFVLACLTGWGIAGWHAAGLKRSCAGSWRWLLGILALGALMAVMMMWVQQSPFISGAGIKLTWAMIAVYVLVGPFAEELFFRGLLTSWLHHFLPRIPLIKHLLTIVITTALFVIAHEDMTLWKIRCAGGLMTGWLRAVSGSVWYGFVVHALANASLIALAYGAGWSP